MSCRELLIRSLWLILIVLPAKLLLAASEPAASIDVGAGKQPQVAVAANGSIDVVYGRDGKIFFVRSTDGGATYSKPSLVASPKFTPLGMRRGPRIAALADGAMIISFIAGDIGGGRDGDLVAYRSADAGETWRAIGKPITDVTGSAREGLHAMAAGPKGQRVFCAWLDLRTRGTKVYGSLSTDAGNTFGPNVLIYESPDGHVCECCHPSVAFDRDGGVYVMFRNWLDGNRDLWLASSRDGVHFDPAHKLGEKSWKLNACPMDGGGLSFNRSSRQLNAVHRRASDVLLVDTTGESMLGQGKQPAITTGPGDSGRFVAWTADDGRLMLLNPSRAPAAVLSERGDFPALASADNGPAVCAFESNGHVFVTVLSPASGKP